MISLSVNSTQNSEVIAMSQAVLWATETVRSLVKRTDVNVSKLCKAKRCVFLGPKVGCFGAFSVHHESPEGPRRPEQELGICSEDIEKEFAVFFVFQPGSGAQSSRRFQWRAY